MTKRVEALLREIMENGLVFDVRTDTNDNGGGKVLLFHPGFSAVRQGMALGPVGRGPEGRIGIFS